VNLLNRDNDLEISVRATNIDKHRVTFHSLFYRILTPTSTNFLDFGSVLLNSPAIRTFNIDNISNKSLLLDISSSLPDEIKIYTKADDLPRSSPAGATASSGTREMMKESFGDKRMLIRSIGVNSPSSPALREASLSRKLDPPSRLDEMSPDYLDLAASIGRKSENVSNVATPDSVDRAHVWKNEPLTSDRILESEISGRGRVINSKMTANSQKDASADKDQEINRHISTERVRDTASNVLTSLRYAVTNNNLALVDFLEAGDLSLDELVALLEVFTGTPPPLFASIASEERYIRAQRLLKTQLDDAISNKSIIPLSTADVAASSELMIIIVYTPTSTNKSFIQVCHNFNGKGKYKKMDAKILIRLNDFDRDIDAPRFEQLFNSKLGDIPARELLVRSSLIRSVMELGQKNINFGTLEKSQLRKKTIVIRNISETPLLYSIRKSGLISSGDLIIADGRIGIIKSYGKREVEFTFEPTIPGSFHEKLVIENVQDSENNQIVSVKAVIRKPHTFVVESLKVDFGMCLINEPCPTTQEIIISNTSQRHSRLYQID
jgi:hypothetical protein